MHDRAPRWSAITQQALWVLPQALAYKQGSRVPPDPGGIRALIPGSRYIDPMVGYKQDRYLILPLDYPCLSMVKFLIKFPVAMPKGKTPVPIPNTEVKPFRADDTMIAKVMGK